MFKLLFSANLRDSLVAKTQRLNSVVDHLFVVDIANGPTQKEYYNSIGPPTRTKSTRTQNLNR
jgi:hypothetical protein